MVKRINDDDACFCGNGTKYKECHGPMLSKYNWRALKTEDTIDEIQNISKEIREFYKKNIQSFEKKIIYAIDEEKESEGAALHNIRCATDEKGLHIIVFTNENIGKMKDSIIAHEFSHIQLQEEKFPTILPSNPEITSIANQLNNILQDPLIYIKLKPYFNVIKDFESNVEELIRNIKDEGLPNNGLYKFIWELTCSRTYLIQESLFGKKDETGFRSFLEKHHPNYINNVSRIVNIFNENGYDTPKKQNLIIEQLSKKFPLKPFIKTITL